jgi:hypothetical protein
LHDDTRTTPLGLFHYARSYWRSGVMLNGAKVSVTHPAAPVTMLLAHAIELYLKAFLRLRGLTVKRLASQKFGHNFRKLAAKAEAEGLTLDDEDREVVTILHDHDVLGRARYIETGPFVQATAEAMERTCKSLDGSLAGALRAEGHPVRDL